MSAEKKRGMSVWLFFSLVAVIAATISIGTDYSMTYFADRQDRQEQERNLAKVHAIGFQDLLEAIRLQGDAALERAVYDCTAPGQAPCPDYTAVIVFNGKDAKPQLIPALDAQGNVAIGLKAVEHKPDGTCTMESCQTSSYWEIKATAGEGVRIFAENPFYEGKWLGPQFVKSVDYRSSLEAVRTTELEIYAVSTGAGAPGQPISKNRLWTE